MTLRKGLPAKLALTDADDTRYDFGGLVVTNYDGSPRGGVFGRKRTIVTGGSTLRVDVQPFFAAAIRDGGVVLLSNDAVVSVDLTPAPGANSRIDVVYAKQNDSSSTVTVPDPNDFPVIGVVSSPAAPSPVKPALPVGAVELGMVVIPAGVTATNQVGVVFTQSAQYTAGNGGVVPVASNAERDAWTSPAPGDGQLVMVGQNRYRWEGTASKWIPDVPYAWAVGTGTAGSGVAPDGTVNATITFPSGRFTSAPVLSVLVGNSRFTVSLVSVSATSAVVQFKNVTAAAGTPGAYHWHAIQA